MQAAVAVAIASLGNKLFNSSIKLENELRSKDLALVVGSSYLIKILK